MEAPTASDLLTDVIVQQVLDQAWADSLPDEPTRRHEEGGWIYMDTATSAIAVRRSPAGRQAVLDLESPPILMGSVVVATFHTHPNPVTEGWDPGPSPSDTQSAHLLGVPCIIRAADQVYITGPKRRRGGLRGNPGYPA